MKFELNEDQVKKLGEWQEAVNVVFGEYGTYEFRFKNCSGIGTSVAVYSSLTDEPLDLTDVDKW